jgi:hypothetical protein
MGAEATFTEIKKLIKKAHKMQLTQQENDVILRALQHDQELVFHIGLNPQLFHELVLNNATIAYKVLISMNFSKQIASYYDALSSMPMTVHSLEVFNNLSNDVELPKEYM